MLSDSDRGQRITSAYIRSCKYFYDHIAACLPISSSIKIGLTKEYMVLLGFMVEQSIYRYGKSEYHSEKIFEYFDYVLHNSVWINSNDNEKIRLNSRMLNSRMKYYKNTYQNFKEAF